VHIVLENDRNEARYLGRDAQHRPLHATAQWNDDFHHAAHVVVTGEIDGYYADYADRPLWYFGRCLAEGFGYQGETSSYRGGIARGEPSVHLPPAAFVNFLQTHDQVGNRALGERIGHIADPHALRAAIACLLLSPSPPLLFMGEEFAASTPFLFFCDFGPELADAVTQGRRREFSRFDRFRDPGARDAIPDPNRVDTFEHSKLDWSEIDRPAHGAWLALYRECLHLRATRIVPRLTGMGPSGAFEVDRGDVLYVDWTLGDGARLHLAANFSRSEAHRVRAQRGEVLYATERDESGVGERLMLPCSVIVTLDAA
jgi:maltooligosyltrehalose trehalohydrolase